MAKDVLILSGARTPMGEYGGALKDLSAIELGAIAARAAIERGGISPDQIDHTVVGNAMQTSGDAIYGARHVALKAGVPVDKPALTVNRLCGSGIQAIVSAAQMIQLGEANAALAGGMESMSQAPHVIRGARWGFRLGEGKLEDSLMVALLDTHCGLYMAQTAENLARKHDISREEQDEYALLSQKRAAAAWESGRLKEEVVPVELKTRKGTTLFEQDDHMRPDTTLEGLARLKPAFSKDGHGHCGQRFWNSRRRGGARHRRRRDSAPFGIATPGPDRLVGACGSPARDNGHRPCARITKGARRCRAFS